MPLYRILISLHANYYACTQVTFLSSMFAHQFPSSLNQVAKESQEGVCEIVVACKPAQQLLHMFAIVAQTQQG